MRKCDVGLWAGIDEAGYGPNLGPLVMTCVTAEAGAACRPDLWRAFAGRIDRARGAADALWVDDSKRILACPRGYERLESTALALIGAISGLALRCDDDARLFESVGAGGLAEVELAAWMDDCEGPSAASDEMPRSRCDAWRGDGIRLFSVHAVVLGPAKFNRWLSEDGNKARVHFRLFQELVARLWRECESRPVGLLSDKHGGRNYYYAPLVETFPEAWVDRGEESADRSTYVVKADARRLSITLEPKADQGDGLVALASMVSKYLRERWMRGFNRYWQQRVPGLRITAGYARDAARFRRDLEAIDATAGRRIEEWWRLK